jgi:hypothetical protein
LLLPYFDGPYLSEGQLDALSWAGYGQSLFPQWLFSVLIAAWLISYIGLFLFSRTGLILFLVLHISTAIMTLFWGMAVETPISRVLLDFIGYFSSEYFADSLGWPITLVLMGVAFLGVGTIALKVKRRI